MQFDVIGLGNALLDYQVNVPFEFLKEHGLKKGSMTLVDADLQHKIIKEIRSRFSANEIKMSSGGCSANTLAGITNYGGSGFFIGKVGQDPHAEIYKKGLAAAQVDSQIIQKNTDHTGSCLALITPDAERTMLTHLGIASELEFHDLDFSKLPSAKIVYIEGYLWDSASARATSIELIKWAKQKKMKVAFTYSDSFCVNRYKADFIELAKNSIDILFCNEDEAKMAAGTDNFEQAFEQIKTWSERVCVTTGPRGALVSEKFGKICEAVPTWDAKLVDKLGAGDLFAAGYLYGLSAGKTLRQSAFLGCYAATRVIQQISARLEEKLSLQIALQGPTSEAVAL